MLKKVPWRKIIVIGSTFLLGISTGLGIVMAADPAFNTTFAGSFLQRNQPAGTDMNQLSQENAAVEASGQPDGLTEVEQAKVVDDYKMSLALLFEAWRSPDMQVFEKKIIGGYTGDLRDRHLDRAQAYISNGKGLYVDDLKFNLVMIESATSAAATIVASYTYTARDFDLNKTQAYGSKVDHQVHVRAELVKVGDRWLISGETAI
ncbi:MAG: hypothetical protein FWG14_06525 [Peptococcaceae bacterium]|nr:hypothetical protein [Peptococcaceae bacterium]